MAGSLDFGSVDRMDWGRMVVSLLEEREVKK